MAFKISKQARRNGGHSANYIAHITQNTKRFCEMVLDKEIKAPYPINKEIAKALAIVYNWLADAKVYRIEE